MAVVLDNLVYVANSEPYGDIVHIAGDVFAAVYTEGVTMRGILITFPVDNNGNFGAIINTYVFEALYCITPRIIRRDGTTFIIVYCADDGFAPPYPGRIITTVINNDGTLGGAIIDSLYFGNPPANVAASYPDIIQVFGDIYAITYRDNDNDLHVGTIDITAAGNIGAALIADWEFEPAFGLRSVIAEVAPNIFAIAYNRNFWRGTIVTCPIDNFGNIGAQIDIYEFNVGIEPFSLNFFEVAAPVFAVIFADLAGITMGYVLTIDIDNLGNIGAAPIQTQNFEVAADHVAIDLVRAVFLNNVATVFYREDNGVTLNGKTNAFEITNAGVITIIDPEGWQWFAGNTVTLTALNRVGVINLIQHRDNTTVEGIISSVVTNLSVVQTNPATEVA